ncbi:hypothetical protein NDU88_005932 [Pleurodeles waltl]|uniref:Uncharacterized protein n=1 Tax=Pleurodeles waltl TaxID=8319 RepID=A0AAV7TVD0_PLEWA|nr:hypothetical protein NDU88_005932 [Pleurodeles waltl]
MQAAASRPPPRQKGPCPTHKSGAAAPNKVLEGQVGLNKPPKCPGPSRAAQPAGAKGRKAPPPRGCRAREAAGHETAGPRSNVTAEPAQQKVAPAGLSTQPVATPPLQAQLATSPQQHRGMAPAPRAEHRPETAPQPHASSRRRASTSPESGENGSAATGEDTPSPGSAIAAASTGEM